MSARLDLWVMWRTALVMAGGAPVSLDQVPGWAVVARPNLEEAVVGSLYPTMGAG